MNTGLACRGQGAVMGLAAGMRHFGRDRGGLSWFVFGMMKVKNTPRFFLICIVIIVHM